jgi:hypothetical protein
MFHFWCCERHEEDCDVFVLFSCFVFKLFNHYFFGGCFFGGGRSGAPRRLICRNTIFPSFKFLNPPPFRAIGSFGASAIYCWWMAFISIYRQHLLMSSYARQHRMEGRRGETPRLPWNHIFETENQMSGAFNVCLLMN